MSENNNCTVSENCSSGTCNMNINCGCTPCTPSVFTPVQPSINNLAPVLADNIISCVSLDNSQYMRSSPVTFTIDNPCNIVYDTDAPICIQDIRYNYGCLGITLPLSFDLCNGYYTFNTDNGGCPCTINSIPESLQDEISNVLSSANSTISAAQSVLSALTPEEKRSNAITAASSLASTIEDTVSTVQDIFNNSFGASPSDPIVEQMENILEAADYLSQASSLSVSQINAITPATVQQIASLIYNPDAADNSALEYIREVANFVISYPGAPAQAVRFANTALNIANTAQTLATSLNPPPAGTTFTDVNNLILETYTALAEAEGALNLLSQSLGRSDLTQYFTALQNTLIPIYLLQYVTQAIFDSSSYTGSQQLNILDSAARAIIDAANDAKSAVNFSNEQTTIYVYNDFIASFQQNNTNTCCNTCDLNQSLASTIFYQPIYSFQVCDLQIKISGTIGSQCFTASASFPGLTRLEDIGLTPIKAASQICIPRNSAYTLHENFTPCLSIVCVLPENAYDTVNSPSTFDTTIYSYFGLTTNLTVTKKAAVPVITQNVNWNCSDIN